MLWTAIVLFLLAAGGGLFMAARIFRDEKPPAAVAVIHGLAAATALILVIIVWLQGGASTPLVAGLGILVLAALGGFFLLSFHIRGKAHPKPVVLLHALLAVAGVIALLVTAL